MLADDMKAYEYFKHMIEVDKVDPLEAFLEALEWIKINDSDIQEAIAKERKEIEKDISASVVGALMGIVDVVEGIAEEVALETGLIADEKCGCPVCMGEMTEEEYEEYEAELNDEMEEYAEELTKQLKAKYGDDIEVDIQFFDEEDYGYDDED